MKGKRAVKSVLGSRSCLLQILRDRQRAQFSRGIERSSLELDLRVQSGEWGEERVGLQVGQERRT